MLQWHVGNSTSADLVLRDVQDAIVSEVTSFPVDKVALGESPSVAMHVPVPTLRQSPDGGPCSSQELGASAMKMNGMNEDEKGGNKDDSCDYASGEALVAGFPRWAGWTQPATALTLLVLPALYRVVRGERTEVPETGTSDENPNPQLAS